PRNGRHQSPAAKKVRDDFIQDARAMPEIVRWTKPFAAILNWFINPNGMRRAAACDRKPAANPTNADFGLIFLKVTEDQRDRRTIPPATVLPGPRFGLEPGWPTDCGPHFANLASLAEAWSGRQNWHQKPSGERVGRN